MEELVRPAELKERIDADGPPRVLDVRRAADFDAADAVIPGSERREPEQLDAWASTLDRGRPVVVYCVRGGSVSRGVAEALRARGVDARFLEGGIAAWSEAGFPTARKPSV